DGKLFPGFCLGDRGVDRASVQSPEIVVTTASLFRRCQARVVWLHANSPFMGSRNRSVACKLSEPASSVTHNLRTHPVPDTLGYRKRIGIVVPSTNTTVEPECEPMRPRGVTNHIGRSTIKERPLNTEQAFFDHMQAMREGTGTAIDQIMTTGVDHLIMGVALETFWGGVAAADKLQQELAERSGVEVSMGSTAAVAALRKFGAKTIAVVTPHQPRGDEIVRAYLTEA